MIKNSEAALPLCHELEEWCMSQKLPYLRADDLALKSYLTAAQKDWLSKFSARWESLKLTGNVVQTTEAKIMKNTQFESLEAAYIDAADELRSKQVSLVNFAAELEAFISVRDALKEHPDFPGHLPKTYFSGGDLDPDGCDEKDEKYDSPSP